VVEQRTRWRNRIGWLWLTVLGPIIGGIVAALSPFGIEVYSPWPSRVGYFMVLAVVWLAPLTLIWRREGDCRRFLIRETGGGCRFPPEATSSSRDVVYRRWITLAVISRARSEHRKTMTSATSSGEAMWMSSMLRSTASRTAGVTLKGAFIQIMPLTWDSFLPPVMDRHPWQTI
jgi:hypothetical protein